MKRKEDKIQLNQIIQTTKEMSIQHNPHSVSLNIQSTMNPDNHLKYSQN